MHGTSCGQPTLKTPTSAADSRSCYRTWKFAGLPDRVCTFTPHFSGSRSNASSARFWHMVSTWCSEAMSTRRGATQTPTDTSRSGLKYPSYDRVQRSFKPRGPETTSFSSGKRLQSSICAKIPISFDAPIRSPHKSYSVQANPPSTLSTPALRYCASIFPCPARTSKSLQLWYPPVLLRKDGVKFHWAQNRRSP